MLDLSTPAARLAFVTPLATKYGLDATIVAAVCERESEWDPSALRFEPKFEARYIKPALPLTPTTRELTLAMSFGLMQVMGEVALELGFKGTFFTELCIPEVGVEYGCKKFQKCLIAHGGSTPIALLAYNGGSNKKYDVEVLARVPHYTNV